MNNSTQSKSLLTCPECGHKVGLEMPSDACQFFKNASRAKPFYGLSSISFDVSTVGLSSHDRDYALNSHDDTDDGHKSA